MSGSSGADDGDPGPPSAADDAWPLVELMLTRVDDVKDGVRGSVVVSLHQSLNVCCGVPSAHQKNSGALMKTKMGSKSEDFINASSDNDKKVSKKWGLRTEKDASGEVTTILCSGGADALKRLHATLVKSKYATGDYEAWDSKIPVAKFNELIAVAPWKKLERKQKKGAPSGGGEDDSRKEDVSPQKAKEGAGNGKRPMPILPPLGTHGTDVKRPRGAPSSSSAGGSGMPATSGSETTQEAEVSFANNEAALTAADSSLAVLRAAVIRSGDDELQNAARTLEAVVALFYSQAGTMASGPGEYDGLGYVIRGDTCARASTSPAPWQVFSAPTQLRSL